ncbi:hypothetical protein [Agrobacterium radiobacter]|uniref:hypothetical protein n=1 Tax=Agrobacterium radiobacter TaxID=362 RepID=UPI003F84AFF1
MSKTTNKFSPEVRARAVRMVLDHQGEYELGRETGLLSPGGKFMSYGYRARQRSQWI